jgi:prevent-host-death family protein
MVKMTISKREGIFVEMNIVPLTSAKARFSELINRLIYQKAMITITKRGRNVAVLLPWEAYQEMVRRQKGRLLDAAGCLSDYDRDIADMARLAEDARRKAKSRKSPL